MKRFFFATFSRLLRDIYGTSFHTHTQLRWYVTDPGESVSLSLSDSPSLSILATRCHLRSHLERANERCKLVSERASKNVLAKVFFLGFAPVKRCVPPVCDGTPVCSIQTWSRPRPDPGPGAIASVTDLTLTLRARTGVKNRCSRRKHLSHVVVVGHHFVGVL